MKRLQFNSKRQFKSHLILLVGALIVVLYLVATVGFKFLLNSSLFLANIFSKDNPSTLSKTTDDVYGQINIDSVPVATSSASFVISGSIVNYDVLSFYINGKRVKKIENLVSDTFLEEIGELEKGENEVYVKAETEDGKNSKKTTIFSVLYKAEKPKLEISEPGDKSTTSNSEVTVKGKTDREVFIKVNDLPLVVGVNGDFDSTVRLKEGENTIKIEAIDIAGNTEIKTISITYDKES